MNNEERAREFFPKDSLGHNLRRRQLIKALAAAEVRGAEKALRKAAEVEFLSRPAAERIRLLIPTEIVKED